jgi:hypothetical protein
LYTSTGRKYPKGYGDPVYVELSDIKYDEREA